MRSRDAVSRAWSRRGWRGPRASRSPAPILRSEPRRSPRSVMAAVAIATSSSAASTSTVHGPCDTNAASAAATAADTSARVAGSPRIERLRQRGPRDVERRAAGDGAVAGVRLERGPARSQRLLDCARSSVEACQARGASARARASIVAGLLVRRLEDAAAAGIPLAGDAPQQRLCGLGATMPSGMVGAHGSMPSASRSRGRRPGLVASASQAPADQRLQRRERPRRVPPCRVPAHAFRADSSTVSAPSSTARAYTAGVSRPARASRRRPAGMPSAVASSPMYQTRATVSPAGSGSGSTRSGRRSRCPRRADQHQHAAEQFRVSRPARRAPPCRPARPRSRRPARRVRPTRRDTVTPAQHAGVGDGSDRSGGQRRCSGEQGDRDEHRDAIAARPVPAVQQVEVSLVISSGANRCWLVGGQRFERPAARRQKRMKNSNRIKRVVWMLTTSPSSATIAALPITSTGQ